MEFDELLITTGVDALVRLVKEKKQVELPEASRILNIPESTIEDWAHTLEEEHILGLEYRLTKVFLVWVQPTEQEVKRERASFLQEKSAISKEADALQGKLRPEVEEVRQLKQAFEELYSKFSSLKPSEKIPAASTEPPQMPKALKDISGELVQMRQSIGNLHSEWGALEKKMGAAMSPPEKEKGKRQETKQPPRDKINELLKTLSELDKKVATMQRGVPQELPLGKNLESKMQELKHDFHEMTSRQAQLRDNARNLGETQEILAEMKGQLKHYEDTISGMRTEVKGMNAEFQKLEEKSRQFSKSIHDEIDAMGRFSDSIEVAKDILSKYPPQQKVLGELATMSKREEEIKQKMDAVEKLLSALGSPKELIDQFTSLRSDIARERKLLEGSAADLATPPPQMQKESYEAFEKVREKTRSSIDAYNKALSNIEVQLAQIEKDGKKAEADWQDKLKEWKKRAKDPELQAAVKSSSELESKRKLLETVREKITDVHSQAEGLNRRLNLLSQQAKLLELRSSVSTAPTAAAKPDKAAVEQQAAQEAQVKEQLTLTQQEEEEFRKKRDELRELIQKLWKDS